MNANAALRFKPSLMGFSVVELMVAVTIGLVILLATTTIFVQSKQTHTTQDSLARLQENGRFGMQFLMRDLRMGGYFGCADDTTTVVNTLKGSTDGGAFDVSNPIQGSEAKSNWYPLIATPATPPANMKAGTDAFALRYLDASDAFAVLAPLAPDSSGALQVSPGSALQQGDIVAAVDCGGSAIFQVTGATSAGSLVHVADQLDPGNFTANLGGKIYELGSQVVKYHYASYYIADGASQQPALFRDVLVLNPTTHTVSVQSQELVEGIENMQILYGEDMTGDRVPDRYVKADAVANWRNVVAMRIGILARSLAQTDTKQVGQDLDTNTYDVDGDGTVDYWDLDSDGTVDTTPPNDRYQRRIFRTTVLMRNLQ